MQPMDYPSTPGKKCDFCHQPNGRSQDMSRSCYLPWYSSTFCRRVLALLLLLGSPAVLAQGQEQEQWYRVELLVLRHLDGGVADQEPVPTLRDFSAALDLMPPPGELDEPGPPEEEPPPLAVVMTERTETLQEAWRRLRLSADIRPELYLSWQQSADEPFPLIRVHDDRVLVEREGVLPVAAAGDLSDPDPGFGSGSRADAQITVPTFTDANTRSDGSARAFEGAADESGERALELEPPPPILFYQVDGTARLRRSRFLHLELDVEVREPLGSTDTPGAARPAVSAGDDGVGLVPPGAEFRVHHIRQQRQVRTQEMAYFDGPVVGILALVTRVDPPLPDPDPDSGPELDPTVEPATDRAEVRPVAGN